MLLAASDRVRAEDAAASPWFMHASDPQVGFGLDGRSEDGARFERLLAHAAQAGAQFVVVTGDLVQDRTFFQWRTFEQARASAALPVHLVVGNHDVVDRASLHAYRERLGPDYYAVEKAGVTLIVVNSETARDGDIDPREHAEQWAWLERTLRERRCGQGALCVLAMHRPPFVEHRDEAGDARNWPEPTRRRLLDLLARHAVHTVLAGHLHQTRGARDPESGLEMFSVGGTARVFDDQGAGYRAFSVAPQGGGLRQRYVRLEQFPAHRTQFLGIQGWTPRLFDPSLRHWLLTLGLGLAGLLAWRAASAWRRAGARLPNSTAAVLWRVVAVAFLFLGANEQLDIDELTVGLLRALARSQNWIQQRHAVGAVVAALTVSLLLAAAGWLVARAGKARRTVVPALVGLTIPGAWFVLATLSDHNLGLGFSMDVWDVLLFGSLPLSLWACLRGVRDVPAIAQTASPHGSASAELLRP
jgi:Icc-related predicted phosphoesterase